MIRVVTIPLWNIINFNLNHGRIIKRCRSTSQSRIRGEPTSIGNR